RRWGWDPFGRVRVIDRAKRRPVGLTESAARLCPSRALKMRAPFHARTLVDRRLPVADESLVGGLGPGGQLFFEPVLLGRREDADGVAVALTAVGAGEQLRASDLLAH